ncbi:MAG TPA: hypothetical protein VGK52_09795 [Polyangia bacterium]|jgi:hypothetical protein
MRSQGVTSVGLVALGVTLSFLFSGPARAQDRSDVQSDVPALTPAAQAVVDKIVQMNKRALDDYDTLEWDSAKRTLLEALVAGKKGGLDGHPVMARTYLHLGCVYITGLKDRQKGVQSFVRSIEIDPTIKIEQTMTDPELEAAFAEAAKRAKPRPDAGVATAAAPTPAPAVPAPPKPKAPVMEDESAPPPPKRRGPIMESTTPPPGPGAVWSDQPGEPDLPAHIDALDCPTPDEVPPDKAVRLRCAAADNLGVAKVFLMYRLPGSEDFGSVEMVRTPKGWYQGKLPKKAVTGKSVQLYFEARNAGGKAVVSNGRADSPNLILIREEGAAREAEAEAAEASGRKQADDVEENPLEDRNEAAGPRLYLGKVDKSKIGLDTRYGNRRWWIGIGIGSGYGYAKGNGLETRPDLQSKFTPGLGWAGLGHLAPEVGFQVTPDFALSVEGRNQWIPQGSKYAKFTASGAQSVLARALFYTKQQRVRFFGSLMAGGGEGFRFVLYPDRARTDYKDTVRGGPFLAGAGLGLYVEMSRGVSFVTELNGLAGFPIFSAVADVNVALQFNIY